MLRSSANAKVTVGSDNHAQRPHLPDDALSLLLERVSLSARVFHSGVFCGATDFDDASGASYLHVLHAGGVRILDRHGKALHVAQPSVALFLRAGRHALVCDASTQAQLVCASVALGGGAGEALLRWLPETILAPLAHAPALQASVDLLFREARDAHEGRQAILDRLCEVLLVQLLRHSAEQSHATPGLFAGLAHPRIAQALSAMHGEPGRRWQLAQLAQIAHMSRSAFAGAFRNVLGATPGAYLAALRLSCAQQLLAQGKPLKLIADEVGYESSTALSRAFSKRVGQSPRAWVRAQASPAAHEQ
jgi:AraC-like DNA-binding protein